MSSKARSDFRGEYLRRLPSVGKLMEQSKLERMLETCPRVLLIEAIYDVIDARKTRILTAVDEDEIRDMDLSSEGFVDAISTLAAEKARMSLRGAINATGDALSRNLGRAPLNEAAQKALQDVSSGYSTLTADVEDRNAHVQHLLTRLTGAEAGLAVNNNAAAVMLILNTLADGKEVIVSRGQLIESDGFRLPDVVARSGAKLVSVGATNKTRSGDYSDAISENTGAILKVHQSHYRIVGFSADVSIQELAAIGKKHNIPVIDDIGGGCLIDLTQHGLPEEPPAFLSIRNGADIVCFSGDEFLSGPQAGIVVGSEEYISRMKKSPLYRVLRSGKLVIAALEATLRLYLDTDRILEVNPALRFLSRPLEEIESMSRSLVNSVRGLSHLAAIGIEDGYSRMDSISVDPERFPTKLISIKPTMMSPAELDKRLRSRSVPVFAMVREDQLLMDMRAVWHDEINEIASALVEVFPKSECV